jgi:hypothetical protein
MTHTWNIHIRDAQDSWKVWLSLSFFPWVLIGIVTRKQCRGQIQRFSGSNSGWKNEQQTHAEVGRMGSEPPT